MISAWLTSTTAPPRCLVPPPPVRIVVQLVESPARPLAEVDFVESRIGPDLSEPAGAGDCDGGFLRALARAGMYGVEAFAAHALRQPCGLRQTGLAKHDASGPASKKAADVVMRGVPDKEEGGGHSAAPSSSSSSPAMKRNVRSRASASVNCCGGDFMK
jgi:hypothetical protein